MTEKEFALYALEKARKNIQNFNEMFNVRLDGNPKIGICNCDYCGKEIDAIWDDYCKNNWCYFGVQAIKPNVYKYSPVIQYLRKINNSLGQSWNNGNNLLNSHTRIHCEPSNYDVNIKTQNAIKVLCNECFKKTYNRVKIELSNGFLYSISILETENVEDVLKELNIRGNIIGKGSIHEY